MSRLLRVVTLPSRIGPRLLEAAILLADNPLVSPQARISLWKKLGLDVVSGGAGRGCRPLRKNIHLGEDVWLNHDVWFDASAEIHIGDRTAVGPGTRFVTATHRVGPTNHRAGEVVPGDIHVGRGCFLGAHVIVLPGLTIEDGCVIGAGAVVTSNCTADGLYVGVPARRARDLT